MKVTPDISVIFTIPALGRLAVTATDAGIRAIRLLGPGGWSATGGGHGSHPLLDRCRYELAAYAAGRLRVFTVPVISPVCRPSPASCWGNCAPYRGGRPSPMANWRGRADIPARGGPSVKP